ncbi:BA75_00839T0 [Komagataella pastoris]|uniref:BA75_00839T0 n=1 Tax=Komagataella pastoris TaxID=4922 RepID=A0A1B2J5G2_PICPA|nr:BA75_00839T0 [Komagataella pastoris]
MVSEDRERRIESRIRGAGRRVKVENFVIGDSLPGFGSSESQIAKNDRLLSPAQITASGGNKRLVKQEPTSKEPSKVEQMPPLNILQQISEQVTPDVRTPIDGNTGLSSPLENVIPPTKSSRRTKPHISDTKKRQRNFNLSSAKSTIDLLQLICSRFLQAYPTNAHIERLALSKFGNLTNAQFSLIADLNKTRTSLSKKVSQVHQSKKNTRKKLLELRHRHALLRQQIEKKRAEFRAQKRTFNDAMNVESQLKEVSNSLADPTHWKPFRKTAGQWEHVIGRISKVQKILDRDSGLVQKLRRLNGKLERI